MQKFKQWATSSCGYSTSEDLQHRQLVVLQDKDKPPEPQAVQAGAARYNHGAEYRAGDPLDAGRLLPVPRIMLKPTYSSIRVLPMPATLPFFKAGQ